MQNLKDWLLGPARHDQPFHLTYIYYARSLPTPWEWRASDSDVTTGLSILIGAHMDQASRPWVEANRYGLAMLNSSIDVLSIVLWVAMYSYYRFLFRRMPLEPRLAHGPLKIKFGDLCTSFRREG